AEHHTRNGTEEKSNQHALYRPPEMHEQFTGPCKHHQPLNHRAGRRKKSCVEHARAAEHLPKQGKKDRRRDRHDRLRSQKATQNTGSAWVTRHDPDIFEALRRRLVHLRITSSRRWNQISRPSRANSGSDLRSKTVRGRANGTRKSALMRPG